MTKAIKTDKAPAAIGPYSQGVAAKGEIVYCSGQLPIDMATGKEETADIKKATQYSIENCKAVLEAAGASLADVVKTIVFLTDINDFAAMNEVYARYFKENPPARSAVQVGALPKGAHVEVEMLAVK
jgi:2-iminobutanoate/2-iminopropanoate deaminase